MKGKSDMDLLIIDATGNVRGFEYNMTDEIFQHLIGSNINVSGSIVNEVNSLSDFVDAVNSGDNFDFVLLVAHGAIPDKEGYAFFAINGEKVSWAEIRDSGVNLDDKHLFLCCCHAFNEASIQALVNSCVFALPLVAPTDTLTSDEAKVFYSRVLPILCNQVTCEVEYTQKIVEENNYLANDKMEVYPLRQI